MHRLLLLALLLLLPTPGFAASVKATAHITSQTTTTLVTAVTGKTVSVNAGSICVDGNGAATGIALQSTGGTNIVGTAYVIVIPAGSCYFIPRNPGNSTVPYFNPTASGTGLQIVTTVANGPVNVYLECTQN